MNSHGLLQEVIEQLRLLLGTRLGAPADIAPATLSGQMWTLRTTIAANLQITFAFDQPGASALAQAFSGTETASDDGIKQALRELCDDVAAAAAAKLAPTSDDHLPDVDGDPELQEWAATSTDATVAVSCAALPATLIVSLSASGAAIATGDATAAPGHHAPATESVSPAERLDVLLDIDLPLLVRFGCTQLPLKALSRLGPGSLIDLSRAPDDPVELLVGERLVARGEVVVVSGSYGIRVLEVVGTRDGGRVAEAS